MKDQNGTETLKRLMKEYLSLGLSESEAMLAAQTEDAVRNVKDFKPSGAYPMRGKVGSRLAVAGRG